MHYKFPDEFKSIFDHIGVRYYKALNQKLKIELECKKYVGGEEDMIRVKQILDNLKEPIEVIDMDHCDPNVEEHYTTKEQLLLDVENQGMNPKK
jgi:hypothetical protein